MRRSLTFLALLVAVPASARSQGPVDKGSILVAGTALISRSTTKVANQETTTTGMSLNPSLLFFVAPRFAVGGQLGLSRLSYDGGSASSWQVGPAARLFFAPSSARTLPFAGAGVTLGRATSTNEVTDTRSTNDGWSAEGVVGLTAMVSRQVGITGEAYFERSSSEQGGVASLDVKRTDIGLRFGVSAFLFR